MQIDVDKAHKAQPPISEAGGGVARAHQSLQLLLRQRRAREHLTIEKAHELTLLVWYAAAFAKV